MGPFEDLSRQVYDVVVEEVDALHPRFMKRVNDIDIDYFESIARDSEDLPAELTLELRDEVLADIRQYAVQLFEASDLKRRVDALLANTDAATAAEALNKARELIRSYVYASTILNGSSDYSEDDLRKMYAEARKRDLWERLTQSNKADIIAFHHALMDKTYEQCKDVLYASIESFLSR